MNLNSGGDIRAGVVGAASRDAYHCESGGGLARARGGRWAGRVRGHAIS